MSAKKATDAQIAKALRSNAAIISHAAAELKMDRSSVAERINNSPKLQAVVREVNEMVLDAAEGVISTAIIKDKDTGTARWYMERKGKSRGYGNSSEVEVRFSDDAIAALVSGFGGDLDKLRAFRRAVEGAAPEQ